jgi:hypothetical protein
MRERYGVEYGKSCFVVFHERRKINLNGAKLAIMAFGQDFMLNAWGFVN